MTAVLHLFASLPGAGPSVRLCSRRSPFVFFALALLIATGSPGRAAEPQTEPKAAIPEVTIVGKRRPVCDQPQNAPLDTACTAQRLQDAADAALKTLPLRDTPAIPGTGSSDIHIGIASQTAVRQRLGGNYGHSVHPPRPSRSAPPPRP